MGRPIEFNRDEVLDQALEVFWNTGYTATSVADLVDATSLKPGSLYAAFKSKRGLYMAAIDCYAQRRLDKQVCCFESIDSPLAAIKLYFEQLAADILLDNDSKGCFLVNTLLEVAPHDEGIHQKVSSYLRQIEAGLRHMIEKAQKCGEISAEKDPKILSQLLMLGITGLRVLTGTKPDKQDLDRILAQLLSNLTSQ
ncbi:TetR/AcrR family transcriptional regulator [Spartinivicinus poritis]|uniref:TetR/AcrR family transcriptional regulator n=1 Tax=Spartinivicinus poritis TaxID=2994640 RepID=A0ABT5UFY6_9GAMM|nr:TetR/AcrR family transcriptional regulator [Spartinivicinus sp. A2-2]MDE1465227.1 TetR/AcrR family transcriptional regulator [Spartinivicinus sp. A2-2]